MTPVARARLAAWAGSLVSTRSRGDATVGGADHPRLTSRNDGLDLLRALGAAMVFAGHLSVNFGILPDWAASGRLGIYIFFPLSGYLLSRPFYRGRVDLRQYGIARAARILPAYYLALLGLGLLGQAPVNPATLALSANALDLASIAGSGFGQSWTLGVEMAFYVLLPALALLRGRWLLIGVAVSLLGLGLSDGWWRFQLPASLWAFGLGMLVARYQMPSWWPVGLVLVFAGLLTDPSNAAGWLLTTAGATVLIAWSARTRPRIPFVRWPADLSYGVYLWHLGVMAVAVRYVNGSALALVSIALTLGIAWLSFRYVERPALRWSQRLGGRLEVRDDDHLAVGASAAALGA